MNDYRIRINHLQVYLFYLMVILVSFGAVELFMFYDVGSGSIPSEAKFFLMLALPLFAALGAAMFTFFTCLFFNSKLSPDGIVYRNLILGEETLSWVEVDDVRSQFTFPFYILRKKLPDGFYVNFEQINNVRGSKVCCLPKLTFIKDPEKFISYLDGVLPAGHSLRPFYFETGRD